MSASARERPRLDGTASPWPEWMLSAVVALAFLILYTHTFITVHRFDAVGYVVAARRPDPRAWFDPQHLLYVWVAHLLGGVVGSDQLVRALQGVSAIAAAVCLGMYAVTLQRLVHPRNRVLPWLAVTLLGLSASFWVSAVETDPYALTLASLAAATVCYLRASETGTLSWHVMAGIAAALGTLVHQMVVLFALAYVLALARLRPRRLQPMLAFLCPVGLATGFVYLAVGYAYGFFHDVASLLRWLTTQAHQGPWGPPGRPKLIEGLYGFLYSVAGGAGGLVPTAAVRTAAVLALIGGAWTCVRWLRAVDPPRPVHRHEASVVAMAALGCSWLGIFVPFIVWYAAFHTPHWQFVTMPLLILAVCAADRVGGEVSSVRRGVVVAAMVLCCVVVGALNYVRVIAPLTSHDAGSAFVNDALARMPADARVVAPIGVTTILMIDHLGGDAVFVVPHRPAPGDTTAGALVRLRHFVERSWREGRPVWVFGSLLKPSPDSYLGDPAFRRAVGDLLRALAGDSRIVVLDTTSIRRAPRAF